MNDIEKDGDVRPGDEKLIELCKGDKELESALDRKVTRSIEAYKINHGIGTDHRDETGKKVDDIARREAVLELKESAILAAVKNDIPPALAVKLIGKDKEETDQNLSELFGEIKRAYEAGAKSFISKNNYQPPAGSPALSMDMDRIDKPGVYNDYVKRYGRETVERYIETYQKTNSPKRGGGMF